MVLMAFRTGSYVHNLAERLNPSFEQSESWTYIFPSLKEDEAKSDLDCFHHSNVSPEQEAIGTCPTLTWATGNPPSQPRLCQCCVVEQHRSIRSSSDTKSVGEIWMLLGEADIDPSLRSLSCLSPSFYGRYHKDPSAGRL